MKSIEYLKGTITIVIVAHRLSTIADADIIYVMDKGRIICYSNYGDLMQQCPVFQEMAKQVTLSKE
jgi:ABC-type multidrug transport system fused ATPase/permease subunit|tara:strand:+ start:366 stop:563 length:198 start_codon:yes stop_codon:yes gene_type:complete